MIMNVNFNMLDDDDDMLDTLTLLYKSWAVF